MGSCLVSCQNDKNESMTVVCMHTCVFFDIVSYFLKGKHNKDNQKFNVPCCLKRQKVFKIVLS